MGFARRLKAVESGDRAALVWTMAIVVLAMALRVFFWVYTGRIWEDCLITTLHSENFWRGMGLTHWRPGEPPLHGFTSPLSVLIPMLGDAFRIGAGIAVQKSFSVLAGGLAVFFAYKWARRPSVRLSLPAMVLALGYIAFEHHQVLFGMAGMETQVVTAILLATLYFAATMKPLPLGICCGLSMLARPDFAFWVVIVGVYVLVRDWRAFLKVVAVAAVVYVPWLVFTTAYYGSPIPNTIHAKGMGYHLWWQRDDLTFAIVKREVVDRVMGTYFFNTIFQELGPSFGGHGTHFRAVIQDGGWISNVLTMLAAVGAGAALLRRQWIYAVPIAFVAVYAAYYIFLVPYVFGWYLAPFAAMTFLLSARGLDAATGLLPAGRARAWSASLITAAYLAVMVGVLPWTIPAERNIQRYVEDAGRKQMALDLGRTLGYHDWIGCEPLGYVGYYSHRPVYDWPGLANRQVVAFQREHPGKRTMHDMLMHFAPEAIVLRPHELKRWPAEAREWLDTRYTLDREYVVSEEHRREILLVAANQDLHFMVFRKKAAE